MKCQNTPFNVTICDGCAERIIWLELTVKISQLCFCVTVCYLITPNTHKPIDPEMVSQKLLQQMYSSNLTML